MDGIFIRRAVPGDAARLTAIAYAAKRHWGYPDELVKLWAPELTITRDVIAQDLVYCAVDDADVLALYGLSSDQHGTEFELEHMWVEPQHMGRGLGAMLFRHALATARQNGATALRIASDPNAEGFYLRMGATRIGERPALPAGRTLPLLVVTLADTDGAAGNEPR